MSREKQDYDALREKVLEMLSCKAVRAFIQKKLNITDEEWVKELRPFLLVKGVDVRFQERDVPIILPEIERLISEKKPTRKIKKLLVISDGFWRNRIKDLLSEAVVNNMKENTQICRAKSLGSKDYSGIVKESIGLLKSGYTQTSAAKKMKVSTSILRYHMRKQLSEKEYEEIVCRKGRQIIQEDSLGRYKKEGEAGDIKKVLKTLPAPIIEKDPRLDEGGEATTVVMDREKLAKEVVAFNARREPEKYEMNMEFLNLINPENVFDVHAGEISHYETRLPMEQVCSNDINKAYHTTHHEDAFKLMRRFVYEGVTLEQVDLDPFNADAMFLLPFAGFIATKAIVVSVCCGYKMRYPRPGDYKLFDVPEKEPITQDRIVHRIISILESLGIRTEELLRATLSENGVRTYLRILSKAQYCKP